LVSSSACEQVRGKIDVGFVDAGEQQLKNIALPVRAYALQAGGLPAPRPAAAATFAAPTFDREIPRAGKPRDPLRSLRRTLILAFLLAIIGWRYLERHPLPGFTAPRADPASETSPAR